MRPTFITLEMNLAMDGCNKGNLGEEGNNQRELLLRHDSPHINIVEIRPRLHKIPFQLHETIRSYHMMKLDSKLKASKN